MTCRLIFCSNCDTTCVTNLVASHHTTAAHHPWTTTPIIHCTTTHTFPSTIAPITQLSPITHLPWLFHHTCTSFTHTHISSTLPCTHRKVLFCPSWHSERFPCILFPCVYLDCLYSLIVCCLPFEPACLSISSLSAACLDLCIAPVADSALPKWHLLLPLTLACLTLPCCSLKLHLDLNATDSSRYRRLRQNSYPAAFLRNPGQVWKHSTSCSTLNRGVRLLRNTSLDSAKYLARYHLMRLH